VVAPDGTERWLEVKGRVDCEDGRPVRMMGVAVLVTRRKEAEVARLDAAHEASRVKDEFLATLSHELRTPLNAMIGWLQLLQSGTLPADRAAQAMSVIGRNARLQAQLIEDMLDVSRIITGKLEVRRAPVLLPEVLEHVVDSARPEARARGLEIVADVPAGLPPVHGDVKRLQQVFGNLLANAIKFTRPGGRIAVGCAEGPGLIAVTVSDSGDGIAAEFLPHVFERFRQADSRSTRRQGGLGLGLAITRHLVEQHGGTIRAHSPGPGLGSTFTVELPTAGADAVPIPVTSDPGAESTGPTLHDVRVLVVDDQADARQLLTSTLRQHGAVIQEADNARLALELLDAERFDVLVADIAMPEVDGYELMRHVRARHPALGAVALTAYTRPGERAKAGDAGFNAFLTKPFDVPQLVQAVHDARRTGVSTGDGSLRPSA
jgi:signal transduction histidine kinase/ActR/RegA family two-component response regulator